jgi:hypothetical protein
MSVSPYEEVEYSAAENPNRLTLRLVSGASPNAERIELFTNARESELRWVGAG